jgi:hypothetical protein
MESNIALNLDTVQLSADGKFKSSVLKELKALGEIVDIKQMIREYLESLGRVHGRFRDLVKSKVDAGRAAVDQAVKDFAAAAGRPEGTTGLANVRRRPNGTYSVIDYLPDVGLEFLDILRSRSSSLVNLSRRFVTTRKIPSKPA